MAELEKHYKPLDETNNPLTQREIKRCKHEKDVTVIAFTSWISCHVHTIIHSVLHKLYMSLFALYIITTGWQYRQAEADAHIQKHFALQIFGGHLLIVYLLVGR